VAIKVSLCVGKMSGPAVTTVAASLVCRIRVKWTRLYNCHWSKWQISARIK